MSAVQPPTSCQDTPWGTSETPLPSSGSATGTAIRVPQMSDLLTALALVLVIEGLVGANRGDGHYLAYFVSQCLEFKLY